MTATTLSIGSRDVYSRPKRTILRFPAAATLAQIQTYFTNYAALQKAICGPAIEVGEVTFSLTVPGGVGTPTADINGQEGARFSFNNASLNKWGVWLPGILPTYKVGLKDIDTAPQPVQDWLTYIVTGNGTIAPCNEAEQDVGTLVRAIQSHNK